MQRRGRQARRAAADEAQWRRVLCRVVLVCRAIAGASYTAGGGNGRLRMQASSKPLVLCLRNIGSGAEKGMDQIAGRFERGCTCMHKPALPS